MSADPVCCPFCESVVPDVSPEGLCPLCTIKALADREPALEDKENSTAPSVPGLIIHEEIGEGGFGIVYRATESGSVRRRVALKVLKPGVDTRHVLRRFELERQALAYLEHPHIARFYQAGKTEEGYPYFTMEYIEGVPLTEFQVGCELPELLETFQMVCEGVSFAHDKGVIHRDLNPSNVLVDANGLPKVIDFGIASVTAGEPSPGMTLYTLSESMVGTPAYMAPEQARGNEQVDARADVYSLGTILYECLTGTAPLDAATGELLSPTQARSLAGQLVIPRPSSIALRKIPSDLDWILLRALESDPDKRYQSVSEFSKDLSRFLHGEAVEARGTALPYHTKRMVLKFWKVAFAAILGGLLVFAIVKLNQGAGSGQPDPAEAGVKSIEVFLPSSGIPFKMEISPDGTRGLAIFRGGGRSVFFNPQTGEELGPLPSKNTWIRTGEFSELGDRFLIGYEDGTIRWHDSKDGRALTEYLDVTPNPGAVDEAHLVELPWNSKRILITASVDAHVRVWDEDGKPLWATPLVAAPYFLAVSPDRRKILVGSSIGTINLIDVASQRRELVEGLVGAVRGLLFTEDGRYFLCSAGVDKIGIWKSDGILLRFLEHGAPCKDIALSPDGGRIATACHDGTVRLWDFETGTELWRGSHRDQVYAVGFSPDGEFLASAGADGEIKIWTSEGDPWGKPWQLSAGIWSLALTKSSGGGFNVSVQTMENGVRIRSLSKFKSE